MPLLIIGALMLVGSALLLRSGLRKRGEAADQRALPLQTIDELRELSAAVRAEMGGDYYEQLGMFEGRLSAAATLTAPLSGRPCVWYAARVVREYETPQTTTVTTSGSVTTQPARPAAGGAAPRKGAPATARPGTAFQQTSTTTTSTTKSTQQLWQEQRHAAASLEDGTGQVGVQLEHATVNGGDSWTQFVPGRPVDGVLRQGSFTQQVGFDSGGQRTLGFRMTETILAPGAGVCIQGQYAETGGIASLRPPRDGRLIVDTGGREAMVRRTASAARNLKIGAAALATFGLLALIYGLISIIT